MKKYNFSNMNSLYDLKNTKAGLICGRHSMPVDKYIFDIDSISDENMGMSSGLMFDYKEQELIVKDFIRKNVEVRDNKGNYKYKNLIVYVSGIVAPNASVIKTCFNLNINLKLKHYDRESGDEYCKYKTQIIKDDSINSIITPLDRLGVSVGEKNIFTDIPISRYKNNTINNYQVVQVLYFKNNEKKYYKKKMYIFDDINRANAFCLSFNSSMIKDKEYNKVGIILSPASIENNSLYYSDDTLYKNYIG